MTTAIGPVGAPTCYCVPCILTYAIAIAAVTELEKKKPPRHLELARRTA